MRTTTPTALLDKEELLPVAEAIASAFVKLQPLSVAEQRLLHTLTAGRLYQSVIMSAYSYSRDPGNSYLLVTSRPGWQALGKLMSMSDVDIARFNAAAAGGSNNSSS